MITTIRKHGELRIRITANDRVIWDGTPETLAEEIDGLPWCERFDWKPGHGGTLTFAKGAGPCTVESYTTGRAYRALFLAVLVFAAITWLISWVAALS